MPTPALTGTLTMLEVVLPVVMDVWIWVILTTFLESLLGELSFVRKECIPVSFQDSISVSIVTCNNKFQTSIIQK